MLIYLSFLVLVRVNLHIMINATKLSDVGELIGANSTSAFSVPKAEERR